MSPGIITGSEFISRISFFGRHSMTPKRMEHQHGFHAPPGRCPQTHFNQSMSYCRAYRKSGAFDWHFQSVKGHTYVLLSILTRTFGTSEVCLRGRLEDAARWWLFYEQKAHVIL
ncbi:hypothetical protein NPIL_169361 [Nephila pilipes]|uniref:Uncharacterized protein n=1 Tax=Nephila pilipes TaxID=299642 RepID=A0A8X6U6L7_NEPPI|nr:hypothetical protein NPIL_169361 [Nephila pilipes]